MSQIVIVSGPPGAGKTSVCRALCERYDRTVHLETDDVYGWIRMGYVEPWKAGASRQNAMVSRAAARAAMSFATEGYGVFIDGVVGPAHLRLYLQELRLAGLPLHFVLLLPPLDETLRRAQERVKRLPEEVLDRMHRMFKETPFKAGCLIDSAGLTAEATADRVMAACGAGDCLVR